MVWVELDPEKAAEHRSRLVELVHQLVNRDTLVRSLIPAVHIRVLACKEKLLIPGYMACK